MKLPRDISGINLAKKLSIYGYSVTRKHGSHMRLATNLKGKHHITIPAYKAIPIDILDSILADLSEHLEIKKVGSYKRTLRINGAMQTQYAGG